MWLMSMEELSFQVYFTLTSLNLNVSGHTWLVTMVSGSLGLSVRVLAAHREGPPGVWARALPREVLPGGNCS